ncbi:hypothetical protein [Streptomyces sp. NPDC000888]
MPSVATLRAGCGFLIEQVEHPAHLIGLAVNGHWGGLFDDLVRIPYADAMLHSLPAGVDPLDCVTVGDITGANNELARRHVVNGARTRVLVLAPGVTRSSRLPWQSPTEPSMSCTSTACRRPGSAA